MAEPRTYLRDGRAPVPTDPKVSAVMSRIRSKNTGPEKAMRVALSVAGLRGYRLHYAKVPGRPDIAFVGRKVAVFVHGCFWHQCPHCQPKRPKANKSFWRKKLDRNVERDGEKVKALRKLGWRVITVWDCRLKKSAERETKRVKKALLV
ncbi:MAG: DNA mismatch endonuclease Vsr [Flavobacteriales bacterium]|nr:DNA mismatch endonuclease Vsr [Flavobacteriales bacterium]